MLDRIKRFIAELPSTNWVIFTGTAMGMLTGAVYLVATLAGRDVPLDTFMAWLAFLSGWIGFGVRQFRHKRETHVEYDEKL